MQHPFSFLPPLCNHEEQQPAGPEEETACCSLVTSTTITSLRQAFPIQVLQPGERDTIYKSNRKQSLCEEEGFSDSENSPPLLRPAFAEETREFENLDNYSSFSTCFKIYLSDCMYKYLCHSFENPTANIMDLEF
ncbi:Hypothetical_protein [Hexamita inflata]|uniref:Hypothetical_protein n=1 Tax=Hexamita inflata TaxID=28002 RepID=A0AA86VPW0_9EUKA|nr:Hypothetical protein HINF_LOCUS60408 [Hexamita inflata]